MKIATPVSLKFTPNGNHRMRTVERLARQHNVIENLPSNIYARFGPNAEEDLFEEVKMFIESHYIKHDDSLKVSDFELRYACEDVSTGRFFNSNAIVSFHKF
jgi:hypothetical protein